MELSPYTVRLFQAPDSRNLVYCPLSPREAEEVWRLLPEPRPALAAVSGMDWERDLSPWPAPRAFRGGKDFGGGAPLFLEELTRRLLPAVEGELGFLPRSRGIAGYSLAGLFALWAVYQGDLFDRAASLSGSLWFDGFLTYMETHTFSRPLEKVVLSLGDREKAAGNPRLASVEERTRQAAGLLQAQGVPVTLEWNPGGHFKDVPERIAKGISALF